MIADFVSLQSPPNITLGCDSIKNCAKWNALRAVEAVPVRSRI